MIKRRKVNEFGDETLDEENLGKMIRTNAIREAKAWRHSDGRVSLQVRIGGPSSPWLTIRSVREPVRYWLSVKAFFKFSDAIGLCSFQMELMPLEN